MRKEVEGEGSNDNAADSENRFVRKIKDAVLSIQETANGHL